MTPGELSAAIDALFGTHKGRVADAARAFRTNPDNLRHMLAARRPIPDGLAAEIRRRVALRGVAPPPSTLTPDMDRDGPCGEALDPHLDDLLARAEGAGWHPAEVVAAALSWAVHRAIDGAGPEATRDLLDGARAIVAAAVIEGQPADACSC